MGKAAGAGSVVKRMVDDPMATPAELEARRRKALDRGKPTLLVGKVEAEVRMATLIGGLARLTKLSEAQIAAATRFRSLWDGAQIGAARGIDYGRVRVDGGGAGDAGSVVSIDAFEGYRDAVQALGMIDSRLVELVVCHDMSIHAVARLTEGDAGRGVRRRIEQRLRVAVLRLAVHFGIAGVVAGSRQVRGDGERPSVVEYGERARAGAVAGS